MSADSQTTDREWPIRDYLASVGQENDPSLYQQEWTPETVARSYGRNAWAHGVSIDGARSYSEREHIQQAWRIGWMEAENEQRGKSGSVFYGR